MSSIIYLNEKKAQLIFNNFKYQYDFRPRKNQIRCYRCVKRIENSPCPAFISILNDQVIEQKHDHSHLPQLPIESECLKEIERLKSKIVNANPNLKDIHKEYDQFYDTIATKYGRESIAPHWVSWSKIRRRFSMLLIRNHKDNSCKTSSAQDIQLSSLVVLG